MPSLSKCINFHTKKIIFTHQLVEKAGDPRRTPRKKTILSMI